MKDRKLAVRYARALLATLPEPAAALAADRCLSALAAEMEQAADFRDLMLNPAFSNSARKALLGRVVGDPGLPRQLGNFLSTLVDNRRIAALPSIAQLFHEMREEAQGIVPAEIATAMPLSADLRARAQAAIERVTGRGVRLSCRVEPALIGGAVTKIGSVVYDGSLRTQLSWLRRRMVEE